jgi:tetratricopeptide (TPR) repeat protein
MRKLELNSQAFFNEIDTSLVEFMIDQISDSILSASGEDDPSQLALFFKDSSGSKRLIIHQLLYLPAELIAHQPGQLKPSPNPDKGLRLEFNRHSYSEALRFYQDEILKTTNPAEKLQSLVASARLYNKLIQPDKAETLYKEILKEYPGSLLNGQIPVALMAVLEILKINQTIGDNDELRNNSRQCLGLLLNPPCEYTVDQFDMFYQSFKQIIQGTDPVVDSLFAEIEFQRARTDYLARILVGQDLVVTSDNHFKGSKNGLSVSRLIQMSLQQCDY